MFKRKHIFWCFLVLAMLAIAACGGGGDDAGISSSNEEEGITISGNVVDPPIMHATVTVCNVLDCNNNTSLASTQTGENGTYSVTVRGYEPPFVIKVEGGYEDVDNDGQINSTEEQNYRNKNELYSLVADKNQTKAHVTGFTTLVYKELKSENASLSNATIINLAHNKIIAKFKNLNATDINFFTTSPIPEEGDNATVIYAVWNRAVFNATTNLNSTDVDSLISIITTNANNATKIAEDDPWLKTVLTDANLNATKILEEKNCTSITKETLPELVKISYEKSVDENGTYYEITIKLYQNENGTTPYTFDTVLCFTQPEVGELNATTVKATNGVAVIKLTNVPSDYSGTIEIPVYVGGDTPEKAYISEKASVDIQKAEKEYQQELQEKSTSSLFGSVNDASSTTTSSRADDDSNSTSLGTVQLIVDLNNDGVFNATEGSGDIVYKALIDNEGKFTLKKVSVRAGEDITTRAKLIVEKDGCAPYEKIVELSPEGSLTLQVNTVAVTKQTVDLQSKRARSGNEGYLLVGIKRYADGITRSYAYFSDEVDTTDITRGDVSLGENILNATIPVGLFPDSVTRVTVSLRRFSGASDQKYFPGEFKGIGAPAKYTKRDSSDNEYHLDSVAFSLIDLQDQNGSEIDLNRSVRDDSTNNTITVTIAVPCDALEILKNHGDADTTQDGVQTPIYTYDRATATWSYVGLGTLYDDGNNMVDNATDIVTDCTTSYYVKFDVPAEDFHKYLNIDYPVWFGSEPKTVTICIEAKDEEGNPLEGIDVQARSRNGSSAVYAWTDTKGHARMSVVIDENETDVLSAVNARYEFIYNYWQYNLYERPAGNATVCSDCTDCNASVSFTVKNPFNAKLRVEVLDDAGNPAQYQWVEVYSEAEGNWYWSSKMTDENGIAEFDVEKDVQYTVRAIGEKQAKVDGSVGGDEESDNDYLTVVKFEQENVPPEVWAYAYPTIVKEGEPVIVDVYAWDPNGDKLNISANYVSRTDITPVVSETEYGYFWEYQLNDLSEGKYDLTVTVTDENGLSTNRTISIEVKSANANQAPIIFGLDVSDENGTWIPLDKLQVNKTYYFNVMYWDPDGDRCNATITKNATRQDDSRTEITFNATGKYDIVATVDDGKGGVTTQTFPVTVRSDNLPPIIFDAGVYYDGTSWQFYAYLWDEDTEPGNLQFNCTVNGTSVTGKFNSEYWEYTADLGSDPGNSVLFTVSDGNNTVNKTVSIFTNFPPYFTQPLPKELELNKGDSYFFSVAGEDPDNDPISFKWYVKYGAGSFEYQGEGPNLTYTFDRAGVYEIRCDLQDGETNPISSTCIVSVKSGDVTGKIIIHAAKEGIYVGVHNDDLSLKTYKQTDEYGDVELDIDGDSAIISISATPDIVITPEEVLASVWNDIGELPESAFYVPVSSDDNATYFDNGTYPIDNSTFYSDNGTYIFDNSTFDNSTYISDWNSTDVYNSTYYKRTIEKPEEDDIDENIETGEAVPVELVKLLIQNDDDIEGVSVDDVENADTDGDGNLDKDELYAMFVGIYDKNGDGKLQTGEVEQDAQHVFVQILNRIPEGEYDFTDLINDEYGYGFYEWKDDDRVTVSIENLPDYTYIDVKGPEWSSTGLSSPYNLKQDISIQSRQDNGAYSLFFIDNNAHTAAAYLDLYAQSFTADYYDFVPMNSVSYSFDSSTYEFAVGFDEDESDKRADDYTYTWHHDDIRMRGLYKGTFYEFYSWSDDYNGTGDYNGTIYVPDASFDHYVFAYSHYEGQSLDNGTYHQYSGEKYEWRKPYDSLPSDLNDIAGKQSLAVDIDHDGSRFTFAGDDLSKVNEYVYELWGDYQLNATDNATYDWEDISTYNIVCWTWGNPGTELDVSKLEDETVLPEPVYEYIQSIKKGELRWDDKYVSLRYYPGISTYEQAIDMHRNDLQDMYERRDVGMWVGGDYWRTTRSDITTPSEIPVPRPFLLWDDDYRTVVRTK